MFFLIKNVWWCRTPKNSVVYGSGERRIAVSGVSHYSGYLRNIVYSGVTPLEGVSNTWLMAYKTRVL
jgi:hypothetical protein